MANETLGASFSIDTTDLKTGLAQANRLIRESESEFKSAAAGMDDWSDSEDGLNAKIKQLSTTTDLQRKKVNALTSEYDRLIAEGLDPTSKQAVELRTKINNETAALNKNEAELKKQKSALSNLGKETKETAADTEDLGNKFDGLKKMGGVAVGAIAAVGAACVGAVGAFLGLAESTREVRENFARLDVAFEQSGLSAKDAENTYNELYSVLGDTGKATEAAQQLAQISKDEADLAANTRILTGVMATYGDSIPLEGLAEGIASSSAMSSVQGVLADALEWQGVNLDEFNAKLAEMSTEEERAAFIQQTLTGLYGESADAFKERNADIIAARDAEAQLSQVTAELGAIAEPIMTTLKLLAVDLLNAIKPFVELIGTGLKGALEGAEGAAETLAEGLGGLINTLVERLMNLLPTVLNIILQLIPSIANTLISALPQLLDTVTELITQILNLLTALLPDIVAKIIEIIPLLITKLVEAFPELLQAAVSLLMAIVQAIPTIIAELVAKLPEIINTIVSAVLEALPILLKAAIQLFMEIVKAIPVIIAALTKALPQIINTIVDGLLSALPLIIDAAIQLFMSILEALPVIIQALIDNLPTIINTIINAVLNALPQLLQAAITLFMALINAIPTIVTLLVQNLPKIITTIVSTLLKNLPQIIQAAIQLLGGIISGIVKFIPQLIKQIPSIIKAIVGGLKDGIKDITKIGGDIIKGLWNGIKDMGTWIAEKIKGFGESVLGGIKDFFGIHSPSKVMADQVGKNLALGIGVGFEKNIGAVNDEITKAMNFDGSVNISGNGGVKNLAGNGVTVIQTNNYSQAHSRYELYESKLATVAAVRLAAQGV